MMIEKINNWKEDIIIGDALPPNIHYKNLRNYLSGKKWKELSDKFKINVNWKCENCGRNFINEPGKLHAHEMWLLDYDNKIAEIINIKVLCDYCHWFYHQGLYGILRVNGKISDEYHLIIKKHLDKYQQKGYEKIISNENKKIKGNIFNSQDWIIKSFDDIYIKMLKKVDKNQSRLNFQDQLLIWEQV